MLETGKKEGFLKRAVGNAKALYSTGVSKWKGARADKERGVVTAPRTMRKSFFKMRGEDLASKSRTPDASTFEYNQAVKAKDRVKDKVMKRVRKQRLGIPMS